jgi:hypothetical protein
MIKIIPTSILLPALEQNPAIQSAVDKTRIETVKFLEGHHVSG